MTDLNETICYCAGISRGTILAAIKKGATTIKDIQQMTGAGIGSRCKELNPKGRCCHPDILAILEEKPISSGGNSGGCSCCSGSNGA